MYGRTAILVVTSALVASACAGSDVDEPVPAAGAPTTTTSSPSPSEQADSTTESFSGTSESLSDLSVASSWPVAVTLWDGSGAKQQGALPGFSDVIDGPITAVIEVPLEGWVYQREQYSNMIQFDDGSGERDLLVGSGDQTLLLEGVRVLPDDTAEIIYQRRDPSGQNTVETLRAYNFTTREVREITVTGGFESLTKFSTITGRYAVGLFQGEGHFELTTVDLDTGQRMYSTANRDFDCFDGGEAVCPHYDEALMIDDYVYGFRTWTYNDGVRRGLHRFDLRDNSESVLWSIEAEDGMYARDLIQVGDYLVLSLSSTFSYEDFGNPLPAILYNLSTGETQLAPDPGFVQLSWIT